MIRFLNERTNLPDIQQQHTRSWIRQITALHNKQAGDISFLFCDDEKILEVNRKYLDHDYYTDIITFDYSAGSIVSGDLYISIDTVTTNAMKYNVAFEEELYRVMIHGVLHLCGYHDGSPELRLQMTEMENEALQLFTKI